MALSYRTRRRLSALVLIIGLPLYIVAAVSLTGWLNDRYGRLPILAELAVYVALGFLWALPLKPVFRGVGKPDPGAQKNTERPGDRSV